MRVASVNVGMPREVEWDGRTVVTGIFKSPVATKRPVRRLSIDGDGQADLAVHGGPDKAVYAYPGEHYGFWGERLGRELTPGIFGENLTTEGLLEDAVHIGDEFRIGTARLVVTQPRLPCFKLGIRFADPGMVKSFLQAGKRGSISLSWRRARSAPATRSSASPRTGRGSPWPRCSISCSIETPPPSCCEGSSACRPWRPSGGRRWRSASGCEARAPSTGRRAAQSQKVSSSSADEVVPTRQGATCCRRTRPRVASKGPGVP